MDIKNIMIRAVLSSSGDASATHSIQIFVGEAQGGRVKKELPQTRGRQKKRIRGGGVMHTLRRCA